jgi:hypothetical protein
MDIIGYDSVIFTHTLNTNVVQQFADRLCDLWPNMLMDVELMDAKEERVRLSSSTDCSRFIADERHSIIYFYRDEQMKQHFIEEAGVLDSTLQGPFSLHFRKRKRILFELEGVNEITTDEKRLRAPAPYSAFLCSPEVLEITLVSPGDPREEQFSHQIFSMVLSCI